jgi:hypothetical protein
VANREGALDWSLIQKWNQPWSQEGCPLATDFSWLMYVRR